MVLFPIVIEVAVLIIIVSAMYKGERKLSKFIVPLTGVAIINYVLQALFWETLSYYSFIPMALVYLFALGYFLDLSFMKSLGILVLLMAFKYFSSLLFLSPLP